MPWVMTSSLWGAGLLGQVGPPAATNFDRFVIVPLQWLMVWGEPSITVEGALGGLMTWLKVIGLFSLMGWAGSWALTAAKEENFVQGKRGKWLDFVALAAIPIGLIAAFIAVMITNKRLPESVNWAPTTLALVSLVAITVWVEVRVLGVLRRLGTRADRVVLIGLHLALALGFGVALALFQLHALPPGVNLAGALFLGGRLGATYMGLVVLVRILALLIPEVFALQWRRLYAIAWQSWTEAFRRMWAPWVVLVVFAVILAFTSWFLAPPRAAELGKLYVSTLMLLTSLLVTLAIVIMAPISLPNDISQQTIYTVVTKPVRRLELIWGRMLGYMALVTLLLLLFAGVGLAYYHRQVEAAIRESEARAKELAGDNKPELAQQAQEQADQLETRRSARVPILGSLMFFDSKGAPKRRGIDVGIELPLRSFVEGATPSRAVWSFGPEVPNPHNPAELLDRRVPVESLLQPGTLEWVENRLLELQDQVAAAQQAQAATNLTANDVKKITEAARNAQGQLSSLQAQLENLRQREQDLRKEGKSTEANALHSQPVQVEMTLTVYRTTKGQVGEPVNAEMIVKSPRPEIKPFTVVLPIKEYYTNKRYIPSRMLVGSHGALSVELRCMTANQYLGMAEGDLFLLASQGSFWSNYLKGLLGVWLQAMVLTAIGVCAGTFLSWPVALLITLAFFLAGNIGFTALQQFAISAELVGGGPFEALIRMVTHDNLMTELEATPGVVIAKTLDSIVMPVMARLVYLVPNFSALDVSNTVAEGFAVTGRMMLDQVLLALGYAIPFSIAGYFILRNREVAA